MCQVQLGICRNHNQIHAYRLRRCDTAMASQQPGACEQASSARCLLFTQELGCGGFVFGGTVFSSYGCRFDHHGNRILAPASSVGGTVDPRQYHAFARLAAAEAAASTHTACPPGLPKYPFAADSDVNDWWATWPRLDAPAPHQPSPMRQVVNHAEDGGSIQGGETASL